MYQDSASYYSTQEPSGYEKFGFAGHSAQTSVSFPHTQLFYEIQVNKMNCYILCVAHYCLICLN